MKIALYPADNHGCGHYRMIYPGRVLRDQGHDVSINLFQGQHEVPIPVMKHGATITRVGPVDADVVVFQRPGTRNMLTMIDGIKRQGIKVVVDVDDALWDIDRENVSWPVWNTGTVMSAHWMYLQKAMEMADLITVTTDELGRKNRHSVVLPNYVPESMLAVGRSKLSGAAYGEDLYPLVVGWAATILTHPHDPGVTHGHVADWVRQRNEESPTGFLSVGGKTDREPYAFGFTEDDIANEIAWGMGEIPGEQWGQAISAIDISLVPLANTHFNRSKSRLKAIESAAAGCAVIMSPTPDNVALHEEHGIGTIAKDRKWGRALNRVVREGVREQAERNYDAVQQLTYEANAWRWLEAWKGLT